MDIATGIGLAAGAMVVVTLILMGGDFRMFYDIHAVIIIFGGSISATLIRFPLAAMIHGLPPQAKSSMLEDLERGKRLELPWLSGGVVRLGAEAGVPTPIHGFIATVLRPQMNGAA